MSTKVVVELTPDEEKVLNAFRRVQSSDEKMRQSLKATGDVGGAAAKQLADSFIKGGKDSTASIGRLIAELKRSGDVGRNVGSALDKHLSEIGEGGKRSVTSIIDSMARLKPEAAEQARMMLAEFEQVQQGLKFDEALASLSTMGGEFKVLGQEIRKATDAPLADAQKRASAIVDQLRAIDPTKADAIAKAMENASKSISDSRLESFVSQLAGGTKEAQALAKALGEDLKAASSDGADGVDEIAKKIVALRPEMKSTVDTWRSEMAEASKFGEREYGKVLNALRQGDPVSRQVAEAMKRHLLDVGRIVEPSFADLIKPLQKLDPAMAKEAEKLHKHFDGIKNKSDNAFKTAGVVALEEIAAIGAAYMGLQEVIGFISGLMEDQRKRLQDAAAGHRSLAQAQEEASKNMAAFSQQDRVRLLQQEVKTVARLEGIADLSSLTKGFGDLASAGASPEQSPGIIRTSAALNANNQSMIDESAAGLFDIMKATQIDNAKLASSLVLAIGSQSRITQNDRLIRTMAPIGQSGASASAPDRREQGAVEGMALGAAFSKSAVDDTGESTRTFTMQSIGKMGSFFQELMTEGEKARSELSGLDRESPLSESQRLQFDELKSNRANKQATDRTISDIEAQLAAIQKAEDETLGRVSADERRALTVKKRTLSSQLSDARSKEFTDRDAANLADFESRIAEANRAFEEKTHKLQSSIERAEKLQSMPLGTPGEMVRALQTNRDLGEQFLGEKFGEERFRPGLESLIRGGDTASDFAQAQREAEQNRGSDRMFQEQVAASRTGTPQLEQAYNQRRAEANVSIQNAFDTTAAIEGFVRKTTADALRNSRSEGLKGLGQSLSEIGIDEPALMGMIGGTLEGSAGPEEMVSAVKLLTDRRRDIMRDGVTTKEREQLAGLNSAIEDMMQAFSSSDMQDFAPQQLQNAFGMVKSDADNIRAGRFGQNSTQMQNQDIFFRLEEIAKQQVELLQMNLDQQRQGVDQQKQTAEATKKTAENTQAQRPPLSAAQRAAAAVPPVRGANQ